MTSFQDAPDEAIEADEAKEVRSMDTIIIHCMIWWKALDLLTHLLLAYKKRNPTDTENRNG